MSERDFPGEGDADEALRQGLEALRVPQLSAEFDEGVLAGLRTPLPWWRRLTLPALWTELRPIAAGGACAVALTLGLYAWSTHLPLETPAHPVQGGAHSIVLERQLRGLDDGGELHLFPGLPKTPPAPLPRKPSPPAPEPSPAPERSSAPSLSNFVIRTS